MNPTLPNINTSAKSIDLIQNTNPFFNKSLTHPTMKLPRIQIFKTDFRKLSILSKFWECRIWQEFGGEFGESSCLRHYDALRTKMICDSPLRNWYKRTKKYEKRIQTSVDNTVNDLRYEIKFENCVKDKNNFFIKENFPFLF